MSEDTWVEVCSTDEIDLEDVIPFSYDGVDYAIYRSPEGNFHATEGHCTHQQVLLCDGLVFDDIIECPRHNGRFVYATGKAMGAPVIHDLRTFPVKVDAGTVYIGIA